MCAALLALALVAGCGDERQDADEPEGEFTLEILGAEFPERQSIAQRSTLRLEVRNTDDRELPNLAVTVETAPARRGGGAAPSPRAATTPGWPTRTARSGCSTARPTAARAPTPTRGRSARCSPGRPRSSSGG